MGKSAAPRNVNAYIKSFNNAFDRYMEYIRRTRDADGLMADTAHPAKLLFMESKTSYNLCSWLCS